MDYSLAALKLLSFQLKEAIEATASCSSSSSSSSPYAFTLGGLLFQRAWLQGVLVLVRDEERLLIDDGTGVVELSLPGEFCLRPWKAGMYVMVVGAYCMRSGELPMIKVHKMVDLSAFPDREAMWYLEVLEAYRLFYKPLIEEEIVFSGFNCSWDEMKLVACLLENCKVLQRTAVNFHYLVEETTKWKEEILKVLKMFC